jgi:hypothetical protein
VTLSPERCLTWTNLQLASDPVYLQNQMECLLEEMRIKLSILVKNEPARSN